MNGQTGSSLAPSIGEIGAAAGAQEELEIGLRYAQLRAQFMGDQVAGFYPAPDSSDADLQTVGNVRDGEELCRSRRRHGVLRLLAIEEELVIAADAVSGRLSSDATRCSRADWRARMRTKRRTRSVRLAVLPIDAIGSRDVIHLIWW